MAYQATVKTETNKANRRRKIIQVTQQRISEAGFAGVSMSNIADKAGIATGTLYRYFPSKQALCTEVFQVYTEVEINLIRAIATEANKTPAESLILAIQAFAHRAIKSRHLAWSLIAEPLDPALETERLRYRQSYASIYQQLIEEGIEQRQFRAQISSVSAAAIVGSLAESLVGPLSELARNPDKPKKQDSPTIDQKKIVQNIVDFCLSAVGHKNPSSK